MSRQSNWIKRWVSTPYLRVRIFHGMPFNTMNVSENITVNLLINKIKAKTAICFLIGDYLLKVRVLLPATYAGIAQLVERQCKKNFALYIVRQLSWQSARLIIARSWDHTPPGLPLDGRFPYVKSYNGRCFDWYCRSC